MANNTTLARFFASRAPKQDSTRFGLQNTYVFFSKQGALFGALLATTFVVGTNYANNMVLGVFFYLVAIWAIGTLLAFLQVHGVRVRVVSVLLAPAGGQSQVMLELTGKRAQALILSMADGHAMVDLQGSAQVSLFIDAPSRGEFWLPRLTVKSYFPLGVSCAWGYANFDKMQVVYPKPLHAQSTNGGDKHRQGADFDRLDEYQQGEPLSRISWRHLAKNVWLAKRFDEPDGSNTYIDYRQMMGDKEQRLAQMAHLVLAQTGEFSFYLTDERVGAGKDFIDACLYELAIYDGI